VNSRNTEYQFIETDTEKVEALLVSTYEKMTGVRVKPASPEKVFIQYIAAIIIQERALNNYTGNQNVPSRAEGKNLDALADLCHIEERPKATAAVCTERFHISEAQETSILVPAGTRVRAYGDSYVWETVSDAYVPIGETWVEVQIRCQTAGSDGNGYAIGQINTLIDIFDYCKGCENISVSDGGSDEATDEEFYNLMRASMDSYSCAGAKGGYIYFAKKESTEIADVVANSPEPGVVKLYVLMDDGTVATEEVKNKVLAACSADTRRPLTDLVLVEDAEAVTYDIAFTYYTQSGSKKSAADIKSDVEKAVKEFTTWQCAKLGRDINPSYLIGLLMDTGIKRVELTSPAFTVLRDGSDKTVPQFASVGAVTVTNGGYEDE